MKARVFSAYIKDVDKRPQPSVWGEKLPFNTICGEYASPAGGWVHAVGFSPSGDVLAFASKYPLYLTRRAVVYGFNTCSGHDSSISIVYPGGPAIYTIRTTTLPLVTLTWTSEESIVAAGHDCQPFVFSGSAAGWQLVGTLDDPNANKTGGGRSGFGGGAPSPVGRLQSSAFNTFRNAAERGISNNPGSPTTANSGESELFTVHQNTITSVRPYAGQPGAVAQVSTSGVDGKLVVWDANAVTPVTAAGLAGKMGRMGMR